MGENPPLLPGVIRMTIPDGPPVSMDQFTLGKSYGAMDFARDCGCEPCQRFLQRCEQLGPYTDMVSEVRLNGPLAAWLTSERHGHAKQ